jgi:Ca2+-binding RTX toxin-like protein
MGDDSHSIGSLQRAARLSAARDEAHYRVLRIGEALGRHRGAGRRVAFGAIASVALLAVVLTATAVAGRSGDDGKGHRAALRTAPAAAGGTGADETLMGTARGDRLDGRGGDDVVLAGLGDDVVFGSRGDDVLDGGHGDDVLWAGPGRDVLVGGEGDDELRAANLDGRPDRLHCGPGDDVAYL